MRTYYFDRDVKFKEFKDAGLNIVDNRLRAADYHEIPFGIELEDSFVMIEKYKPSEDGNIDNYTTDRVEGKGFGGKVLAEIANIGIKIVPEQ
jgi:hypothetical protein